MADAVSDSSHYRKGLEELIYSAVTLSEARGTSGTFAFVCLCGAALYTGRLLSVCVDAVISFRCFQK